MTLSSVFASFAMSGMTDRKPERLYLDTNVFIEMFEKRGKVSDCLLRLFAGPLRPNNHHIVTSHLTLAEILVDPIRHSDETRAFRYQGFLQDIPGLMTMAPVTREVLHRAALIRARQGSIRMPDAIHIATAREQECRTFISNDFRIKGIPYFDHIVPLDPVSIDNLFERLG
jgi:predicted nucleic acid-binding protein